MSETQVYGLAQAEPEHAMKPDSRKSGAPMTVRRLAQQGGVTVHVVRSYLRRGLLRAASHTDAGYQLFSADELQRLRFIRTAQSLGFTLAEIEEIFRHSRQRRSPCPYVRDITTRRLRETRAQLDHLMALLSRMSSAVDQWAHLPDAAPTGNDLCALIDAVADSLGPPPSGIVPHPFLKRRTDSEKAS